LVWFKNSRVARLTYLLFDGFVGAELARLQKEGGQGQPLQKIIDKNFLTDP
jgi:hypothetical protein